MAITSTKLGSLGGGAKKTVVNLTVPATNGTVVHQVSIPASSTTLLAAVVVRPGSASTSMKVNIHIGAKVFSGMGINNPEVGAAAEITSATTLQVVTDSFASGTATLTYYTSPVT